VLEELPTEREVAARHRQVERRATARVTGAVQADPRTATGGRRRIDQRVHLGWGRGWVAEQREQVLARSQVGRARQLWEMEHAER